MLAVAFEKRHDVFFARRFGRDRCYADLKTVPVAIREAVADCGVFALRKWNRHHGVQDRTAEHSWFVIRGLTGGLIEIKR